MAECPSCHSQVEIGPEYFGGLFTCPRCQSVYFIAFDGTPEGVPPKVSPVTEAPHPSLDQNPFSTNSHAPMDSLSPQNPTDFMNPDNSANFVDYDKQFDPVIPAESNYSGNFDSVNPIDGAMDSQNDSQNFQDFNPASSQSASQGDLTAPINNEAYSPSELNSYGNFQSQDTQPNPLQEITDFGNSEAVGTALTYRVLIKGLDIVQHIEELREILDDSKLGLSFDKLKSGVKNGQLLIEKVEASQAAILAQRLRTLPVEMVWEQKIYE